MTITTLCKIADISRPNISAFLNRKLDINLKTLSKLFIVLDIDVEIVKRKKEFKFKENIINIKDNENGTTTLVLSSRVQC